MITLTTEQAQQIEEALAFAASHSEYLADDLILYGEALATIRAARAQEQNPVAWYDKIKGMEVSVDVSTGEDDDYHRIFGRVDGVMLQSCGAQEDTILVIEDSRNFDAPQPVKLEPIGEVDPYMDFLRINWKDDKHPPRGTKLYAAPVRTKDLTAQEKANIIYAADHRNPMAMIDAAIALYREKNK